ncbi:MAG: hypothetical protein QM727_07355 [Niabella sp.]
MRSKKIYIKHLYAAFLFVLGCYSAAAQQDTLDIPLNNPLKLQMVNHTLSSATGILVQPFGDFRRAELQLNAESGNFRLPQEAQRNKEIIFSTQGIRTLNKWTLYGQFAYDRTFADSLAWDLSSGREDGYPYYFATPKAGNWDKENYVLKGLAAYSASSRVKAGLAVGYYTGNAARTNDPRPSVSSHAMDFEPFVHFSAGKAGIALSGIYGYGSAGTDVIYMNEAQNDRPSVPEYVTYEVLGYGNIRSSEKYHRTFQYKNNKRGVNLQADMQLGLCKIWARIGYMQKSDTLLRDIINYHNYNNRIGWYKVNEGTVMAGVSGGLKTDFSWNTLLSFNHQSGKDALFVTIGGLNNYVYESDEILLLATATKYRTQRNKSDFGLSARYHSQSKKDGVTQHQFSADNVFATLLYGRTFASGKSGQWIAQVLPGVAFGNATLNVPSTQENIFTEAIARPEVAFYGTNNMSVEVRGGYGLYISGKQFASALLTYKTAQALSNRNLYKNRDVLSLSLNFNF